MGTAQDLQAVARALVAPGKGILAADESTGSIQKRLESVGVESTEENRRAYRDMLFTTKGAGEFISGVIMFDETIRQATKDGTPFVKVLADNGIIPGIKVDTGAKPLAFAPNETVTEGLDGLRARLVEYRELGAKYAKWRAVIDIAGDAIPSCSASSTTSASPSTACSSSRTWSSPARSPRNRSITAPSPSALWRRSAPPFPRPCPASSSCRAACPTKTR